MAAIGPADEALISDLRANCPFTERDEQLLRGLLELQHAAGTGVVPQHLRELLYRLVTAQRDSMLQEIQTRNPQHANWRGLMRPRFEAEKLHPDYTPQSQD